MRDLLLGQVPKDVDLTTSASLQQVNTAPLLHVQECQLNAAQHGIHLHLISAEHDGEVGHTFKCVG